MGVNLTSRSVFCTAFREDDPRAKLVLMCEFFFEEMLGNI